MENNTVNIFCIRLFDLLSTSSLSYCVLRNYQNLPDNTGGSDLDIWVREEDVDKFIKILENVSKQEGFPLVSYVSDKHCPKLCYLGLNSGMQIDVFKGNIFCRGKVMIPQNVIMNHIEDYRGIAILNDIFADLIAFLKEIINNGHCKEKYIDALFNHKITYGKDYLGENLSTFSEGFLDCFHNCIKNRETLKNSISSLSRYARKDLGIKRYQFSNLKKLNRSLLAPGYVIAIVGTDGSGKSTIIKSITPILNEAFHNGVEYYHLRPHWLPDLGVLFGKRGADKGGKVTNPHDSKPSGLFMSLLRWGYYLLDYSIGYLCKVGIVKKSKSHVILFDRYYYDYYIDPHRLKASIPCWLVKIGDFFVPSPDVILCLGGDPEKIFSRKPETTFEEVSRQVACLRKFCSKRKNTVWINTTQDIKISVNETMITIKNMMERRFLNVEVK